MTLDRVRRAIDRLKANRFVARVLEVNGRFGSDGGGYLCAAITYYAFFSLFPLMLLGASIAGFVLAGDPARQADLAHRLTASVPGLGSLLGDNVGALVESRNATGIVGVVGALWSGTALARAASYALSRVFRTKDPGNFLKTQAWVVGTTIALGALAVGSTIVSAAIPIVGAHGAAGLGLRAAGVLVSLILDLFLFVSAYKMLHRGKATTPLRRIWRGALLPAAGWTTLKFAGAWYAARTVKGSTAAFGAFASVVAILVLLFLVARLFVYGAEINAVLEPKLKARAVERKAA